MTKTVMWSHYLWELCEVLKRNQANLKVLVLSVIANSYCQLFMIIIELSMPQNKKELFTIFIRTHVYVHTHFLKVQKREILEFFFCKSCMNFFKVQFWPIGTLTAIDFFCTEKSHLHIVLDTSFCVPLIKNFMRVSFIFGRTVPLTFDISCREQTKFYRLNEAVCYFFFFFLMWGEERVISAALFTCFCSLRTWEKKK